MIEHRDVPAAQLAEAAFPFADIADHRCRLVPVGAYQREHVGKYPAVGRIGAPIPDGYDGNLLDAPALRKRVANARGQRFDQGRAGRPVVVCALVALDTRRVVVPGFTFFPGEFHAVDAAVARVEHLQVVEYAARNGRTARGVGTSQVKFDRHDLLPLLGVNWAGFEGEQHRGGDHGESTPCGTGDGGVHVLLLSEAVEGAKDACVCLYASDH